MGCPLFVKYVLTNVIRVRLEKQNNAINKPTNAEKTKSKQIQDSCSTLTFIEFMCAKVAKEQTQEKGDPFVSHSNAKGSSVNICVGIGVGICIVDNNAGLIGLFHFFDLTATMGANNSGGRDLLTAMLTEFCVFLCSSGIFCSGVVIHRYLPLFFGIVNIPQGNNMTDRHKCQAKI